MREVIELLRLYGPVPQSKLSQQCNLQASTVSYLVNDLRQRELIVEVGKEETQGKVGKPGNRIALNNAQASFLGIYVEDDFLHAYLVGIDGKTLGTDRVSYRPQDMAQILPQTIRRELTGHPNIRGIGIAIKAIVYNDGRIQSGARETGDTKAERWDLVNLPEHLRREFPEVPIVVENDANSAAELYRYAEKCDDFVLYMLNDIPFGIGCGLMMDGKLCRGTRGAAGEFFVKNLNTTKVHTRSKEKSVTLENILSAIVPHMLQTAYLLDTARFVLTGSLFANISREEMEQAEMYLREIPIPVVLDYGEKQSLNPGKGVALMAINQYIGNLLEEVEKR